MNGSDRSSSPAPSLTYVDVKPILARLGPDLTDRVVLVGGQAVNFWADYYRERVPAFAEGPLTSKDIDFFGDKVAVRLCAERLGGTAFMPTMDDQGTASAGSVVFVDGLGFTRQIDFVDQPHGLSAKEISRTAMPFEIEDAHVTFRVMHPVLCMESRVCNTMGLPGYDTPHAFEQLRAAVICAREFLSDLLLEHKRPPREVLDLNERIFRFATRNFHGKSVFAAHGIEPFDAVLVHERLPEMFRTRRYPRMKRAVQDLRRKQAAAR